MRRFPPPVSGQKGVPPLLAAIVVFALGIAAGACGGRPPAPPEPAPQPAGDAAPPDLAPIARIGGVQDVWPFAFGFDADRATVEKHLGSPSAVSSRPVPDDSANDPDASSSGAAPVSNAEIVTWVYNGVSLLFYVDDTAPLDFLISVRVISPDVAVRGGLFVGMNVGDAVALLGEPGFEQENQIVYFYYSTTIELIADGELVAEIVLSRVLP